MKTVVIATANVPNRNDRIYTIETLQDIVERKAGTAVLGQIGMPSRTFAGLPDTFNLSHRVLNLRLEGENLVGDVEILSTPQGKMLNDTIASMDFRFCGVGKVNKVENGFEVSDFTLSSINAVQDGA